MSIVHHLPIMQAAASVRAHRIVRELDLPWHERTDVCQDLLLEMLPRFARYDPCRASAATFISVLARHAAHAVRHQHRRKDLLGQTVPLDSEHGGPDLPSCAHDRDRGELKRKVERAVSTLPAPLRDLVVLLADGEPGETRRRSGLSHATFYRRLGEIRLHFLGEGLGPPG